MTLYDLIVLGVVALSAFVGFIRGGVREIVTVAAFAIAALVAVFSLRLTAPMARAAVDPDWAAVGVAIVLVFLLVYIALRVFGGSLTRKIQASAFGPFDKSIGLGFGVVRGLIALGVFHLVLHAVTPAERVPRWINGAATYPVTAQAAAGLRVLAREGSGGAERFGPAIEKAVREGAEVQPGEGETSYPPGERRDLDALVEDRAR